MKFIKVKKARLLVIAALFVFVAILVVFYWSETRRAEPEEERVERIMGRRRAIDGVWENEDWADPVPFAVIMENSGDAWPLSGIADANLVWEAPTEASIPRLLAVFGDGRAVEEIGPVRSARPYFTDWAEEFGAVYAHIGGSPEALQKIQRQDVLDLNEFSYGKFFWRNHRPRPHNVYTNVELLNSFLGEHSGISANYSSWLWKDDAPEPRPEVHEVEIPISRSTAYAVRWSYESEKNAYRRFQGERGYDDADGRWVYAKNVVVFETDITILDSVGRRRIRTLGEGRALVFFDGEKKEAVWRRPESSERTRFFDADSDEEIVFTAGQTWIEVLDDADKVMAIGQ